MEEKRARTGWIDAELGEVSILVAGAGFPERHQHQGGIELPFFKVGNLGDVLSGQALRTSDHTVSRELARTLRAKVIPARATVFAKIGAAIRLNRRRQLAVPACIDNNMMAAVPSEGVNPDYLLRYL